MAADAISEKARQAAKDEKEELCPICMSHLPDVERGVLTCVSGPILIFHESGRITPLSCITVKAKRAYLRVIR